MILEALQFYNFLVELLSQMICSLWSCCSFEVMTSFNGVHIFLAIDRKFAPYGWHLVHSCLGAYWAHYMTFAYNGYYLQNDGEDENVDLVGGVEHTEKVDAANTS